MYESNLFLPCIFLVIPAAALCDYHGDSLWFFYFFSFFFFLFFVVVVVGGVGVCVGVGECVWGGVRVCALIQKNLIKKVR